MDWLPIDPLLGELVTAANRQRRLVIEAAPGAGKTTRLPWALAESELGRGGEILVAEPRRIAARLAAHRVAGERGTRVGERIGYSVRFEDVSGPNTRVRYVTDGVLLRQLTSAPGLPGVAAVVLDEQHERHLATDVAFALLGRTLASSRPDLAVVVMSATLDAEPVARRLGDCPRFRSEGRLHPLTLRHLSEPDPRPLALQLVTAVKTAVRDAPPGDILVFLPGASEIRAATTELQPIAAALGLQLLPLHGALTIDEQARAIERSGPRKVILSTNVAESSLTIDGVTCVIDSGLARVAVHSPWSGIAGLETRRISRASAAQRAGRAGRTAPGLVLRLYSRGDHDARPAHDPPEILRSDLSEVLLLLRGAGVTDISALPWLDAPPPVAVEAASRLLQALGATSADGDLTRIGARMLTLPAHPRLARVLAESERLGIAALGAEAAAILGERDPRLETRPNLRNTTGPTGADDRGDCDVTAIADPLAALRGASPPQLRRAGLDPQAVAAIERARRALQRNLRDTTPPGSEPSERRLRRALLTGFPDRVARRRSAAGRELVLATGDTARLAPHSVVHDAPFLVALAADTHPERSGKGGYLVRLACAIDPTWLFDLPGSALAETEELSFNAELERVERTSRLAFGSVTLDETRGAAPASPAAALVLARAARAAAWEADALASLTARLALLATHAPELGLPLLDPTAVDALLTASCAGATSFAELRAHSITERLLAELPAATQRALHELLPTTLTLPGGRRLIVHYPTGHAPFVASRLQDFFGLGETPRLCRGRIPLTLHLLAPNQREVQVTSDLASFWRQHYPTLRRELGRRYPKHAWPEDGATATPPAPHGRRSTR